jgi:hypothetical protein
LIQVSQSKTMFVSQGRNYPCRYGADRAFNRCFVLVIFN